MADLIAQGEDPQQRWRRPLPVSQSLVLGRAGQWAVPWDEQISRRHARLQWSGDRLDVTRLDEARNPIFFRGQECSQCCVRAGERFVIGHTTFIVADQRVSITADAPLPAQQQSFSPQYLKQVRFRNPDHRIEILTRLPQVLSGAATRNEICVGVVSLLLAGVARADMAAIAIVDSPSDEGKACASVRVIHWDQRLLTGGDFEPSERLILEALRQRQTVLYVWREDQQTADDHLFTARHNVDWAFATPVPGDAYRGWVFYLSGRIDVDPSPLLGSSDPNDLREDVKFAELIAASVGSLGQMRLLERRQASLSQFLSPVVLETLGAEDPDIALAPKETDVTVMFCDLRGFSLETERHAHDLIHVLDRVSKALGIMTHHVRASGGVVGDFQGDAVMGFWGWPLPRDDTILETCRAALAIRREFESAARQPDSPLAGFHVGIGIASGRAVAGKIGTVDQVKVTVFGPVVNLASRLEGMTKTFRAPILLDAATADAVRSQISADVARLRRLAIVRPYGMDRPLEVSELLPPESEYPLLTAEHVAASDAAFEAFVAGRWSEAFALLHRTPTEDRVTDFLTVYIAQHNRTAPPDWDGVITLSGK